MELPRNKLKSFLSEIIQGFSVSYPVSWEKIFIKHLNTIDSAMIDSVYHENLNKATQKDIPTFDIKEKFLIEEGSWSELKNRQINELNAFLENLKKTKAQFFREVEINNITKEINSTEEKISNLKLEKSKLMGVTAETFATKKVNEYYVFISTYKDPQLMEKKFTEEEFNDLDDKEIDELISVYNNSMLFFNPRNLKTAALSPYFLNLYYLCDDNPLTFFGKPIIQLSFYQLEIFGYGRYFKSILSNSKNTPPPDIMTDPDKLIDWHNSVNNVDKLLDKSKDKETVSQSVVGITDNDRKRLGIDDKNGVDLIKEAQKKGGKLSFQDIVKLQEL